MLLLSRHLEVQKRVYEEQQLIIGNDLQRDATFQELSEMKYLDMVLKETLRIYPSVPLVARAVKEDIEISKWEILTAVKLHGNSLLFKLIIIKVKSDQNFFSTKILFRPNFFFFRPKIFIFIFR